MRTHDKVGVGGEGVPESTTHVSHTHTHARTHTHAHTITFDARTAHLSHHLLHRLHCLYYHGRKAATPLRSAQTPLSVFCVVVVRCCSGVFGCRRALSSFDRNANNDNVNPHPAPLCFDSFDFMILSMKSPTQHRPRGAGRGAGSKKNTKVTKNNAVEGTLKEG